MRYIEFKDGQADKALAQLDLGEPSEDGGYYDNGDLAGLAGNLYIHVDGQEWGSLYFWARNGEPTISLGQYDPWSEQWEDRNPLDCPVEGGRDPVMERLILAAAAHWDGDEKIIEAHLSVQAELIADVMPERPAHQNHAWIMARIREHRKS